MVSEKAKMNKLKKLDKLVDDIHGEGLFSDMASKIKRVLNPVLTSMGIYSTDTGNQKDNQTPDVIPTNTPPKQGYIDTLMNGRNNFPPHARVILKSHGDKRITNAVVIRQPVLSFNTSLLNMASFGAFQSSLDKQPYDTLFHLRSVFTLEDGTRVQVEKSEVIHIDTKITTVKKQQEKEVDLPQEPLTINKMLEGAKRILKDKMYSYDGFKNNCQDFQLAIYRGSGLLNPELESFIKQDVSEIAESSPIISKLANFVTGIGGKFNELIHGAGINKKFNKTHLVQSVLFDKKKWKTKDAIKWLQENNYHGLSVDITTHCLRFRQLEPDDYPKPDWHYTTHRLRNGVDLVILYNQSGKTHTIITGSGDLIHIDLGSHTSKNNMSGGELTHIIAPKIQSKIPMENGHPRGIIPKIGGALTHTGDIQEPFRTVRNANVFGTPRPMETYRPLDMKITSQNKLLNNLKKSDLQDLAHMQNDIKKEAYDRAKHIEKIKSITKKRVKSEVKKVRVYKPRNLKTRGSLESKIERLKKFIML